MVFFRLLQWLFRLLYGPLAWKYDWVAALVSAGLWREWVHTALPDLPGPDILELGPGPGHLQTELARRGARVVGLDASPQMGRLALKNLTRKGLPARLVRGLAQNLPFPGESFDQVAATFPAEYILDPRTLAEVYRVLRPGGVFVVVAGALVTGHALYSWVFAWLFRAAKQAAGPWSGWEAAFRAAGFEFHLEERPARRSLVFVIRGEE